MLAAVAACAVLALGMPACGDDDDGDSGSEATDPAAWNMPDQFTAVLGKFVGERTAPVLGTDGLYHVVYELWLTNGKQVPATIKRIDLIDADTDETLGSLRGEKLLDAAKQLSTQPADSARLEASESILIYASLEFTSAEVTPERIVHRIVGTGATNPGSQEPERIDYLFAPWDLSQKEPPVIGAPLRGEGWMASNGCCSQRGAHRGAVQTVNGSIHDSQRYAIDWVRLGPDGRLLGDGDSADPETWNAYGEPVYAVEDGTVVEMLDELEDQPPGRLPDPSEITLETVDGNHVILDLGNGIYAFYAHLKKGSITVNEGDTVEKGDQIAELGNTGNTGAPHLHLHLMTAPSAIAADGIPYVFEQFELTGGVDPEQWYAGDELPLDQKLTILEESGTPGRSEQLPLDLSVVTFPEGG